VDFAELSSLYVPLRTDDNALDRIAQVVRDSGKLPFSDVDAANARLFARKFNQVSRLLVGSIPCPSDMTSHNFPKIWCPHCPAWMCRISRHCPNEVSNLFHSIFHFGRCVKWQSTIAFFMYLQISGDNIVNRY
jgi:predicted amidophosphoribosyltransferase